MNLRRSHQLVEILRATLASLENDASVDPSGEEISQLKRVLVRWIAEAESAEIPQAGTSLPQAETPSPLSTPIAKKSALDLAVALISAPAATAVPGPVEEKDIPQAEDPAAA